MSKTTKLTIGFLIITVIILTFSLGFRLGSRASSASEGMGLVERAWDIIFNDYVDESKLDSTKLSQSAIEGMLKALDDPYTAYLSPEEYKLSMSNFQGYFDGIGAQVALKDNRITIITPLDDSPAAKAGISAGDVILEIDGQSTVGMRLDVAVLKIRGPSGTKVKLLVQHQDSSQPQLFELTRSKVRLSSVRSEMKGDIAYIHITQFTGTTDNEFTPILQDVLDKGDRGIILDLRKNPGGILDVVVDVASHFLREGMVAKVVSRHQEQATEYQVRTGRLYTDLPIVALVDNTSQSGAEVLAGVLKDHNRAVLAGSTTFGKGSVNIMRELDGAGIYITTARWLTPNGSLIEGKGIEPDYKLDSEQDAVQWAIDYLNKS